MSDVVTVRLDGVLSSRLSALAEQTKRTKAFYVREALAAQMEDLEDYYLAAQIAQEYHAGGRQSEDWGALRAEIEAAVGADELVAS